MGIVIEMVNTIRIEKAGPPNDPVDLVSLL